MVALTGFLDGLAAGDGEALVLVDGIDGSCDVGTALGCDEEGLALLGKELDVTVGMAVMARVGLLVGMRLGLLVMGFPLLLRVGLTVEGIIVVVTGAVVVVGLVVLGFIVGSAVFGLAPLLLGLAETKLVGTGAAMVAIGGAPFNTTVGI